MKGVLKMLDIKAPIVPWVGLGNIKLYESIKSLRDLIDQEGVKEFLYSRFLVRYEIPGKIYLFFNLLNGKLFKLTALKDYEGVVLDRIKIGMTSEELLRIDPSFEYDDFEEVYVSKKGVFIVTDAETEEIMWISVFIKELETPEFEEAEW